MRITNRFIDSDSDFPMLSRNRITPRTGNATDDWGGISPYQA
ncbi:hypothetical protein JCM19275_605 [Nonlabens ulvanivorans]|uniref:Uncharacterized protein n=1 Tax=Nonlabens ulvanivorans TaxID=906888 RepID=A0A090QDB9_NONUL|nr:hypothetical protein [Nonlabens ulvanivorans]GAK94291.1 hypothetical protein JCM19298_1419 [Nonlabens ulvanivorans]GAK99788.1 hypothetical protein JCM19314_973 [Nonlabens ulvanivorans]GAL76199.1 hypothetical protein JCM19275_605 [Nonlabens ulvanivorans]